MAGALLMGCPKKKKKPKSPGAVQGLSVAWDGEATVAIANGGADGPALVAVGAYPPPDQEAVELSVDPEETILVSLEEDEAVWRLADGEWIATTPSG